MNPLTKWLIKVGVVKAKPHEKAELGLGQWGRQPAVEAKSKGKVSMSYRVYRAATDTWEEAKEVK